MTHDEINVKIATKVMGLEVIDDDARYLEISKAGGDFFGKKYLATVQVHNACFDKCFHRLACIPNYCGAIEMAWQVLELHFMPDVFRCAVSDKWTCELTEKNNMRRASAEADTAPMAICLAALKALGEDV